MSAVKEVKVEPQGIYKSNLSGNVPSGMRDKDGDGVYDDLASFMTINNRFHQKQQHHQTEFIIGKGAIEISNQ